MKLLPQSFYNRKTLQIARDVLGCFLVRTIKDIRCPGGHRMSVLYYKIVETEAYNGPRDMASHASRSRTERNSIMFGSPGYIYVYFTYGMHYMFNIVTEREGYPAAVLIRAVEPICDCRFAIADLRFDGPARLTRVLEINKSFNGLPVFTKKHGLWISDRDSIIKPSQIVRTARVGVDYAGEYKDKKWRYYIKGNKFVSKK